MRPPQKRVFCISLARLSNDLRLAGITGYTDLYSISVSSAKVSVMKMVFSVIAVIILLGLVGSGLFMLTPYLKTDNQAFAPQTPSSHVSPRLKNIFGGLNDGFSN